MSLLLYISLSCSQSLPSTFHSFPSFFIHLKSFYKMFWALATISFKDKLKENFFHFYFFIFFILQLQTIKGMLIFEIFAQLTAEIVFNFEEREKFGTNISFHEEMEEKKTNVFLPSFIYCDRNVSKLLYLFFSLVLWSCGKVFFPHSFLHRNVLLEEFLFLCVFDLSIRFISFEILINWESFSVRQFVFLLTRSPLSMEFKR